MTNADRPPTLVCHCPAYSWPHRRKSGKCIWNPSHADPRCEECGQPCEYLVVRLDPAERSPNAISVSLDACVSHCCNSAVVLGGAYLAADDT